MKTMARAKPKKAKAVAAAPVKRAPRPAPERPSGKIAKGDVVWIDYEGWVLNPNGTRTLFDTTREEVAKKEGKFEEKKVYDEFPIIVGHGRILPGLDEAILTAQVGTPMDLTIPPDKGACERDPKLIELRPLREFLKQEVQPVVGMEVSLGGRKGTITQVTGGRVRVDYNNPLAGKTLQYTFTIKAIADSPEEKLRAVIEMDYGLPEEFKVSIDADGATVLLPDICKTDERWFVSKFRVIADIREVLGLPRVRFVEEYVKAPPKPEAVKEEAKAQEAKPAARAQKEVGRAGPKGLEERAEEELPPEEKAPEEL